MRSTSMPIHFKVFFFFLVSVELASFEGSISYDKSVADSAWSFLPGNTESFDYSSSSDMEFFVGHNNLGIKIAEESYRLDLEREFHPKKLKLNAKSHSAEIFYFDVLSNSFFSVEFKQQIADPQIINCYTFYDYTPNFLDLEGPSLDIGTCADADINISNTKPKYNFLGDSLIWLAAENQSMKFKFTSSSELSFLNKYSVFLQFTENKFNWVSPIEEIKDGFIANLEINNKKVSDYVNETIAALPQRDDWITVVAGASIYKSFPITNYFSIFYEPTLIVVEQIDYKPLNQPHRYNLSIQSGIKYNYNNFLASFYGTFYLNNLYGFEHIGFNQRSERHFNYKYGSLGISLTYKF